MLSPTDFGSKTTLTPKRKNYGFQSRCGLPLPEQIIAVLVPFAVLVTTPVWAHVQRLLAGAILWRGPHTVAAGLRVLGLGTERRFEKYHRGLSRAQGSGLQGAKLLL